jgi:ribosome-binding protein aMBF1 (putative translation factor)
VILAEECRFVEPRFRSSHLRFSEESVKPTLPRSATRKSDMQEILQKLGDRIRNTRKRIGFSQEAFAEECGLHRTAVGLLERGMSIPMLDTLLIVSQHLGMPLSKFVARTQLRVSQ